MRGFRAIADQVSRTVQMIQSSSTGMQSALRTFNEGIKGLPGLLHSQNKELVFLLSWLAGRSWYFGMDMPLSNIGQLARVAHSGDNETVDKTLADWHRRHAKTIISRIYKCFPVRKPVLTAALTAHEAGDYLLSIPAFLTQADGIAYDYLTENFFCNGLWRKRLREFMQEAHLTELSYVMMSPLNEPGLLRTPTYQLNETEGILNRHQILHGLTCEYGTEINSLKCIGLLDYLHSVGGMIMRRQPATKIGVTDQKRAVNKHNSSPHRKVGGK